jgi:hypothetical protein
VSWDVSRDVSELCAKFLSASFRGQQSLRPHGLTALWPYGYSVLLYSFLIPLISNPGHF